MDERERQAAEDRLVLLEALLAAQDRRHDVVEAVWTARDQDEAAEKLQDILGFDASIPAGIVLDMPMSRLTQASRDEIAADVAHIRQTLGRGSL